MLNILEAVLPVVVISPAQVATDTPRRKAPVVVRREKIGLYGYPSGFE